MRRCYSGRRAPACHGGNSGLAPTHRSARRAHPPSPWPVVAAAVPRRRSHPTTSRMAPCARSSQRCVAGGTFRLGGGDGTSAPGDVGQRYEGREPGPAEFSSAASRGALKQPGGPTNRSGRRGEPFLGSLQEAQAASRSSGGGPALSAANLPPIVLLRLILTASHQPMSMLIAVPPPVTAQYVTVGVPVGTR